MVEMNRLRFDFLGADAGTRTPDLLIQRSSFVDTCSASHR
jgi:hypothetical protein